jgi:signal transduction histidine kinase
MICNLFPAPTFFLYSNDVPGLLYYSHVPTAVIALLIGLFVFLNGRKFLLNRILLAISVCLSLWILTNLILWTNIDSDFLLFTWTVYVVLFSFISVFSLYFMYVFLDGEDISFRLKAVLLVLLAPVLLLAPTYLSLGGFNITSCDAFEFEGFWYKAYYLSLAVLVMLWILALLVHKFRSANKAFRKQIVLMGVGIEFFLFSFFTVTFIADYLTNIGVLPDSRLEFYGLIGMIVFMVLIAFAIVRYHAFNVKLIGAQALIVALVILIGSEFFFIQTSTTRILTAITLIVTGFIGLNLIRSVNKEVEQREHIEKLAHELEETNQRQESLIHFVSHEVKGFLTKDIGAFAALSEGDFGPLPETMKPFVAGALEQSRDGARSVIDILQASNQKKGTVDYKKEPFDLAALVKEWFEKLKPLAEKKGLAMTLDIDASGAPYTVTGDGPQTGDHVLRNLIENSINYTPKGSVTVSLKKEGGKAVFAVADTGVGISDEDKKRLFTEGGKGKESIKVNAHSTGYGLFIAKNIVVAEGGTIRAESEGPGKGSRFIAEFPAA